MGLRSGCVLAGERRYRASLDMPRWNWDALPDGNVRLLLCVGHCGLVSAEGWRMSEVEEDEATKALAARVVGRWGLSGVRELSKRLC